MNHAIFKCLLFLGAGSVLHGAHTRNMEEMGGLIGPDAQDRVLLPGGCDCDLRTAAAERLCHEWLTYQALLAGFGTTESLTRVLFPVAGALLALTAALAATCFVKAFGITFLALPRSEKAERARESDSFMVTGMAILAGGLRGARSRLRLCSARVRWHYGLGLQGRRLSGDLIAAGG